MAREQRIQPICRLALPGGRCSAGLAVWQARLPFPGWWPLATFVFVATLLESFNTQLRLQQGLNFLHHAHGAALLFGGLVGSVVAASRPCSVRLFAETSRSRSSSTSPSGFLRLLGSACLQGPRRSAASHIPDGRKQLSPRSWSSATWACSLSSLRCISLSIRLLSTQQSS